MSSLRLALKLSMEDSAPELPPPPKPAPQPAKRKRASSDGVLSSKQAPSDDDSDGGGRRNEDSSRRRGESKGDSSRPASRNSVGAASGSSKPKAKTGTASSSSSNKVSRPKAPTSDVGDDGENEAEARSMDVEEGGDPSGTAPAPSAPRSKSKKSKVRREKTTTSDGAEGGGIGGGEKAEGGGGGCDGEEGEGSAVKKPKPRRRKPDPTDPEGKNAEGAEGGDGTVSTPRYQSNRAAAMVAKVKLNSRGPKPPPEVVDAQASASASASAAKSSRAAAAAAAAALQWVACDRCGKWRSLPSYVDMSVLPEQWYCSMNEWDDRFNDCSLDQEEVSDGEDDDAEGADDEDGPDFDGMEDEEGSDRRFAGHGGKSNGAHRGVNRTNHHQQQHHYQQQQQNPYNFYQPYYGEESGEYGGEYGADGEYGMAGVAAGVGTSRRKVAGGGGAYRGNVMSNGDFQPEPVEKVNWVQCNKCAKWRKVPEAISVESLPDVWQCGMNTWNPSFARCSAKEETEEPDQHSNFVGAGMMGGPGHRGMRPGFGPPPRQSGVPLVPGGPVKKVIQWVQCERRNCKKWRKLPGHVDMSQLPEKWFCEMNEWDLDRANCECPEDSDSEGEQAQVVEAKLQLTISSAKGPGSLSYRRIIFGTDGRVRPNYNEMNKNGFGLFSYTDPQKPTENNEPSEEVVEPKRRVSYWWSSAYDESGVSFLTTPKLHPSSASYSSSAMKRESRESAAAAAAASAATVASSSSSSSSSLSGVPPAPASAFGKEESQGAGAVGSASDGKEAPKTDAVTYPNNNVESVTSMRPRQANQLLNAARKLAGFETAPDVLYPLRRLKHHEIAQNRTMMELEKAECTVVRSCLQCSPVAMTLPSLINVIRNSYFHVVEFESCRASISLEGIKAAIQRLEAQGEVEVTLASNGDISVQASTLQPNQAEHLTTSQSMIEPHVPVKMGKYVAAQQAREAQARAEAQEKLQQEKERARQQALAEQHARQQAALTQLKAKEKEQARQQQLEMAAVAMAAAAAVPVASSPTVPEDSVDNSNNNEEVNI